MAKEASVAPKERVNIVYRPAIGDAKEEIELPLKFLVMGDFTGAKDDRPVEDRKPVNIDKDNFDDVLSASNVKMEAVMPNKLSADADAQPVRADRDRVFQILLNIIDNAVKFTPPGGAIKITATPKDAGTVAIRITDTGIGIPKNEIPRLGERFYRVEKTRSRDYGGTVLGLSIVKHLMAVHGGSMEIDSAPGQGTTVSLYFPASILAKANPHQG